MTVPPSDPIDIGLAWHSDCNGNLGVGALTVGNMELARRAAARVGRTPRFHLFQPLDQRAPYIHQDIVRRHGVNFAFLATAAFGAIRDLDVMLDIGAGDSFTDIYPAKRYAMLLASKYLCFAANRPLILSPQTIGPFSRQPQTALAATAVRRSRAVFARDPLSMAELARIAPGTPATQVVDVAFALPFDRAPKAATPRVGLNISGLLYAGGYSGTNQFGTQIDYKAFTHALIEAFLARPGLSVELIAHVNAPEIPRDDDGAACDALHARYPATVRVPDFASPSAAKSHISGLDFLAGARMHATIAAYSAGVPVVPISYSRKFEGLFGGLDYPWLVPVKGLTTDAAVAYVMNAFDNRAQLAADIMRGTDIVERGLETYTATLVDIFATLPR
ncbi:polysaccharide pyruvyl transferase family protein [Sandaracinobacteroides saxicola]|uniref:Polysaccharide pyruvyl transferase family protein n=1 Tax=Sandaracinobacteroides saxicola TaxID=2759707 RepID=A0A7G5IFD1_9SPHN|nr:polysaccharide pyruvyl transferase family protein [Sandaracinobacteroides saxicola]QMW22073.1 polysaccharide pyruvyl transferase family protein [Sandaracinobacteroides saxicola]